MIQKSQFKCRIVLGFCKSGHIYYKLLLIMYVCMLDDKGRLLIHYYIMLLLYFVWEDQRQKQYCICHKMSGVLYGKYSSVVNKHSAVLLISLKGNKTLYCYYFPYTYMDSYHFIYGFTKFPTTLNGYCLLLRDN